MRPAWAEINLANLGFNIRQVRGIVKPDTKIMAIVKADGYGHGLFEVSEIALKNGAERLGVAILDEALALRSRGFRVPILILGYTPASSFPDVVDHGLIQTIFDYGQAEKLSREALKKNRKVPVHVKIDTGMGRLGLLAGEKSIGQLEKIMELPGIFVEGVYTHLANADQDRTYTVEQLDRFFGFLGRIKEKNISIPIRHAANSAGILNYPEAHLDMVRPGIILYGLFPSTGMKKNGSLALKPVMSLKAEVASVKHIPAGSSIGYGCTYKLEKDSIIAVLPLGYADGYTTRFSNNSNVLVHGHRVPLVGRVCMDQIMVDVTSVPGVSIGDEAVLLGKQGDEEVTADDLAENAGVINYEIVCGVSSRVPRKYLL
jgi:alanine racemase